LQTFSVPGVNRLAKRTIVWVEMSPATTCTVAVRAGRSVRTMRSLGLVSIAVTVMPGEAASVIVT
jgi:hypothetical protein